jgi:IclR family pca regulon transcriptional regulator
MKIQPCRVARRHRKSGVSEQKSSEYLTTLEKGLRVLTCFSREQPQMTLSDVARATDLSPAVARRCLLTLLELGYVGKTGADYMLRPKVLSLSTAFTESFNIDNLIRPHLQRQRRPSCLASSTCPQPMWKPPK